MKSTTSSHGRYQFFLADFVTLFAFSARLSFLLYLEWLSGKRLCVINVSLRYVTLGFKLTPDWVILSFFSLGLYFFYAIAKVYRRMINGLREELSMVCTLFKLIKNSLSLNKGNNDRDGVWISDLY